MSRPSIIDPFREVNTQAGHGVERSDEATQLSHDVQPTTTIVETPSDTSRSIQEGVSPAEYRLGLASLDPVGDNVTIHPSPVLPPQQSATGLPDKCTPSSMRVIYNEKATTDEVHPALCHQVDEYTSKGIAFPHFLEIVFPRLLGPGKTDSFLSKARAWLMDDGRGKRFRDAMRRYKSKFDKHELELYGDLAEMCSIPIEGAMNDPDTEHSQRVKLVQTSDTPIRGGIGQRKPDFVLTPENTRGASPTAEACRTEEDASVRPSESALGTKEETLGRRASHYGLRERQTPSRNTTFQLSSDESEDDFDEQQVLLPSKALKTEYPTVLAILEVKRYQIKDTIPAPDEDGDKSKATRPSGSKSSRKKRAASNFDDDEYTPATERSVKRRGDEKPSDRGHAVKSQGQAMSTAVSVSGARTAKSSKSQLSKISAKNQVGGIPSGSSNASHMSHLLEKTPITGVNSSAVQILNYALELHSSSGTRKFTLTARIQHTRMWLYLHSHSVTVVSDPIDIAKESVWFAAFWGMFVVATLPELGFNEYSGFTNPFDIEDLQTRSISMLFESIGTDGNTQTGPNQPSLVNLRLGSKLHVDFGVSTPGTAMYDVIQSNENDNVRLPLVIKFTWHPIGHRNECDMIKVARVADPVHIPEIFATSTVEDADSIAAQLHACCKNKAPKYEPLELRALIMRKFNFSSQLDSDDDFADVAFQLLCCLRKLNAAGIAHRNINIQSCGYINQGERLVAVLCNFDYAICPPYKDTTSHFRVCSSLFMPADHIRDPSAGYLFRHEVESLLYCCIWYGVGYRGLHSKMPKNGRKDVLMDWRIGGGMRIVNEKEGLFKFGGGTDILHFMQESWLKELGAMFVTALTHASVFSLCTDALGKDDICIEAFCKLKI